MRRPMRPIRRRGALGDLQDAASQIAQVAANAGFSGPDLATAVAIALAESSGNPNAVGDRTLAPTRGPSIGLWQINIGSNANPQFAKWNLTDPQTNANAAFAIYSAIGGFGTTRGWTTYTGGAYRDYLSAVPPAPANTGPGSTWSPALTIDASTGAPIDDSTPTPLLTPAQANLLAAASSNPLYAAVAIGVGAALLWDVLS
jgi:lysozyme-like protein